MTAAKVYFGKHDAWIKDCEIELNQKGYRWDDISTFDICEDGSVYLGNLKWLPKNYVTPWNQSERFVEL